MRIVLFSLDYSEMLLQNALMFLDRLRKSKAVVKGITTFLDKFYEKSGFSVTQLSASVTILPLVVGMWRVGNADCNKWHHYLNHDNILLYCSLLVDLLSQYGMDSAIAYTCCQVISRLTPGREAHVVNVSYKITVVALSTLSGNHHNTNFVGWDYLEVYWIHT